MKSICIVTAVPATVNAFLLTHITTLARDHKVTVVSSFLGSEKNLFPSSVETVSINISREISFFNDIASLLKLFLFFRQRKFDLVLSVTPKAGLLSSFAGFLARIKNRVHWFTGQVWVTKSGFVRDFLKFLDKCMVFFLTSSLVDSHSQRDFLINNKILNSNNSVVLGCGSISGVNLSRFSFNQGAREELRLSFGIPLNDKVILFLGRLNKDKGVIDLINAFRLFNSKNETVHLVLVGPDEEFVQDLVSAKYGDVARLHFIGHTSVPENWLSVADIFCLPSYREGFGTSVIEAAAIGIPAV
ncbi:MAG: glycosyltransferase, partial [Paraglaciecola sp.]|nr:glycosyltransferase [Paraglaciecola sp.]